MNRKKGILAAGTLTGLVLVTMLALGFGSLGAESGGGETATSAGSVQAVTGSAPTMIEPPANNSADAAVQAWQEYATGLENTVNTMQQREGDYQTQLDTANQTIINLQDQVNSANASAAYDDDDHEEYEHEEDDDDDYEEHEHEEHEEDDD
ncbi:MAG: hypothetical protein DWQ04_11210 [Chloroflexi bacterium]|nr:MAG: hypothetical protein DWQ04_11210 [Chloroflexota bacterium]